MHQNTFILTKYFQIAEKYCKVGLSDSFLMSVLDDLFLVIFVFLNAVNHYEAPWTIF